MVKASQKANNAVTIPEYRALVQKVESLWLSVSEDTEKDKSNALFKGVLDTSKKGKTYVKTEKFTESHVSKLLSGNKQGLEDICVYLLATSDSFRFSFVNALYYALHMEKKEKSAKRSTSDKLEEQSKQISELTALVAKLLQERK